MKITPLTMQFTVHPFTLSEYCDKHIVDRDMNSLAEHLRRGYIAPAWVDDEVVFVYGPEWFRSRAPWN